MCQAAIRITSKSLDGLNNPKLLVQIKEDIALFIQTMEVSLSAVGFLRRVTAPDSATRAGGILHHW